MSELYRDFIDGKADEIINSLGSTITPAPANAELYRDFLDRKFDDVINACNGLVKVKSFTYKGDDSTPCNIQFPETPKMILGIFAYVNNNVNYNMLMTPPNAVKGVTYSIYQYAQTPAPAMRCVNLSYDSVNDILTIDGANINFSLNIRNVVYTVYYI